MQLTLLAVLLVGFAEASVRHKRITCGRKAEPNEVPWQVLLGFRDGRLDAGYTYELCGGTLYNNNTVITAWHCMGLLGEDSITFWIQTGSLSRTDADAKWIEVDRVVLHPNGSLGPNIFPVDGKEFHSMVNDIALLRLKSDIDITPASKPIPLLREAAPINSFMHCIVSGWGVEHESFESFSMGNEGNYFNSTGMKNGGRPDLLRMTYVYPEFNTTSCQSMYRSAYPTLNITVSNKVELCAGFMGCGDSCNGDSGGPLACLRKGSEQYELAGVVSWGGLCGNSAAPGVYASIPHFKPWIEECTAALDRGIETDNCKHSG